MLPITSKGRDKSSIAVWLALVLLNEGAATGYRTHTVKLYKTDGFECLFKITYNLKIWIRYRYHLQQKRFLIFNEVIYIPYYLTWSSLLFFKNLSLCTPMQDSNLHRPSEKEYAFRYNNRKDISLSLSPRYLLLFGFHSSLSAIRMSFFILSLLLRKTHSYNHWSSWHSFKDFYPRAYIHSKCIEMLCVKPNILGSFYYTYILAVIA